MIDQQLVKKHLRVELDETDQDDLIQGYTDAAISAFESWTNRTLVATDAELDGAAENAMVITKGIEQGALLLIGHWFNNRESSLIGATVSELPLATKALWQPHRWVNV